MKKRIILLISILFILGTVGFSGCTAFKATDSAKEALTKYYDYYNDGDIDECIEMFDESLIKDIGDEDLAEVIFNSRRYLLGEVKFQIVALKRHKLY